MKRFPSEPHVPLKVEGARQRGRPMKTRREVVDKDMNDLHLKPNRDMDHNKWREVTRENRSDVNNDKCFHEINTNTNCMFLVPADLD